MTERTIRPRPFAWLRRHGLRVTRHLDIRAKHVDIHFEVPTQLNSAPMLIYKSVSIGAYTYLRSGIVKHVQSIGRYCSLGPNVTLGEGEHPMDWLSTSMVSYTPAMYAWYPPEVEDAPRRLRPRTVETDESMRHGQVTIGNDVWIGTNAMVRRGVHVGDGAVIGAGAYVNRDVEPYSIVAGVPARVVRMRFDDATIEALLALRWWEFHVNDMIGVPFERPQDAIPMIEDMEAAGTLVRWPVTYRTARLTRQGYTRILGVPKPAPAEASSGEPPHAGAETVVTAVVLQGVETMAGDAGAWQEGHPGDDASPPDQQDAGLRNGADTDGHEAVVIGTALAAGEFPTAGQSDDPIGDAMAAALVAEAFGEVPVGNGEDPPAQDAAFDLLPAAGGSEGIEPAGWNEVRDVAPFNGATQLAGDHDAATHAVPMPADPGEPMTEAVLAAFALEGLGERPVVQEQVAAADAETSGHHTLVPLGAGGDQAAAPEPETLASTEPDSQRFNFPWNR